MNNFILNNFYMTCKEAGHKLLENIEFTNDLNKVTHREGIYFIFKNTELIYIGQSINLKSRLKSHRTSFGLGKSTEISVKILPISHDSNREALESLFIGLFTPQYNRAKCRK